MTGCRAVPWSTVCLSTCWTAQTQHGPQLCTWNAGVYDGYASRLEQRGDAICQDTTLAAFGADIM